MRSIFLYFLIFFSGSCLAENNRENLRDFSSEDIFEKNLQNILEDCLDKSYGGTKASSCFSKYHEAWDKELNYYYAKLRNSLTDAEKSILRNTQLAWIKNRDATRKFNSILLDKKYADQQGTMFTAMRAGDSHRVMAPLTKNRALLLKDWHESLSLD